MAVCKVWSVRYILYCTLFCPDHLSGDYKAIEVDKLLALLPILLHWIHIGDKSFWGFLEGLCSPWSRFHSQSSPCQELCPPVHEKVHAHWLKFSRKACCSMLTWKKLLECERGVTRGEEWLIIVSCSARTIKGEKNPQLRCPVALVSFHEPVHLLLPTITLFFPLFFFMQLFGLCYSERGSRWLKLFHLQYFMNHQGYCPNDDVFYKYSTNTDC